MGRIRLEKQGKGEERKKEKRIGVLKRIEKINERRKSGQASRLGYAVCGIIKKGRRFIIDSISSRM